MCFRPRKILQMASIPCGQSAPKKKPVNSGRQSLARARNLESAIFKQLMTKLAKQLPMGRQSHLASQMSLERQVEAWLLLKDEDMSLETEQSKRKCALHVMRACRCLTG